MDDTDVVSKDLTVDDSLDDGLSTDDISTESKVIDGGKDATKKKQAVEKPVVLPSKPEKKKVKVTPKPAVIPVV